LRLLSSFWGQKALASQSSLKLPKGTTMTELPAPPGLSDNAASGLAYVTIIPAIVFLVMEPYNKNATIRFHCWQSIFLFVACFAIDIVLTFIPVIGWIILPIFGLLALILWIVCVVKAFGGERFSIPVIGPLSAKQAGV